jgi:hypothetical protein
MKSSLRMDLELDNRATATDDALMQHALKKDRKPVESKVFPFTMFLPLSYS